MTSFRPLYTIADLGVQTALIELLPCIRAAGKIATALQGRIQHVDAPVQKDIGHPAMDVLTHADLLIEDRIGSDILLLFADASFHGEERDKDRVSRFIPEDLPFLITLDPVNGTLFYKDGVPQYEIILTICDRAWNMLGAIIYRPVFDEAFIGYPTGDHSQEAMRIRWDDSGSEYIPLRVHQLGTPRILHLDETWSHRLPILREAGYEVQDVWIGYAGQRNWAYSQADMLLGKCCGMVWRPPWSQLIDAAAFGFMVECAGGVWRKDGLDLKTLTYAHSIVAHDTETADLLERLL